MSRRQNFALLLTAGKPTVTVDDDSRFRYRQLGLFCKIAFRLTFFVLAYIDVGVYHDWCRDSLASLFSLKALQLVERPR